MKRIIALSSMLLIGGGCMAPLTRRLDETNAHLVTVNAQLAETNQRLGDAQAKLEEANHRIGVLDQVVQKLLPGLDIKP